MREPKCDNCKNPDKFEGWAVNEKGITVFLCEKCREGDGDSKLANKIFKDKLLKLNKKRK